MLDQPDKRGAPARPKGPALDFQQHLAALEAAGLVTRIDRPIDKDTELHPLVRWQFVGGMPEDKRRAFLFTNVVDGSGKKYDMPVVVGALSAIAAHLCHRHGQAGRGDRPGLDRRHRASDPAGARRHRAPCQEVVIKGDELQQARRRPEAAAGADLDAGLRRRALFHRHALRHQGSGERHPEHGHLPRRAQSHRPARRAHGVAHRRRRRLPALAQASQAEDADADRDRRSAARRS